MVTSIPAVFAWRDQECQASFVGLKREIELQQWVQELEDGREPTHASHKTHLKQGRWPHSSPTK